MPEPLPNALEPTDGWAVSDAVPEEDALVDVVVVGVTALSIGTVICALSLVRLDVPELVVDVVDAPAAEEATPPVEAVAEVPVVAVPLVLAPPVVVPPVVVPPVVPPVAPPDEPVVPVPPAVALVAAPVVPAAVPLVAEVPALLDVELKVAPVAAGRGVAVASASAAGPV